MGRYNSLYLFTNHRVIIDTTVLWRWCMTLRITEFLDHGVCVGEEISSYVLTEDVHQ
jgi:hypothetical protein